VLNDIVQDRKQILHYCQLWAAVWRKWIHLQFISQRN